MKRHPALHDLSRDHFHALNHCLQVRRALEGHDMAQPLGEVARAFVSFLEKEAMFHFREEEDVILPIVGRHHPPTEDEKVRKMLDEHAWFRDVLPTLKGLVDAGEGFETLLGEVAQKIHDHARFEERELFPAVEAELTDGDLSDLKKRSHDFRTHWRGPESVGPYTGENPCPV